MLVAADTLGAAPGEKVDRRSGLAVSSAAAPSDYGGPRRSERVGRDFLVVMVAAVGAFALAGHFDVGERFGAWASGHEIWQADELPFTLIVLCGGLGWFAWRRWRESAALRRQQSALARHLMNLQERERRQLASELHDELGQRCAAIRFEAQYILRALQETSERHGTQALVDSTRAIADSSEALHGGVRRLLRQLRPAALEMLGVVAAVDELVHDWRLRHRLPVEWSPEPIGEVSDAVAICIYRIVQESLTNIARHAAARHALVRLCRNGDRLHLEISDDGVGFSASGPGSGFGLGLVGISERVADLSGQLEIAAAPGRGVRIRIDLPLRGSR